MTAIRIIGALLLFAGGAIHGRMWWLGENANWFVWFWATLGPFGMGLECLNASLKELNAAMEKRSLARD